MFIRLATESDLEAMTWVLIGASPLDPVYPYRFPGQHLYLDEFAQLCRQKCAEYLETGTVVVCEMPTDSDPEKMRAVAFSVWDRPQAPKTQSRPLPIGELRQQHAPNNPNTPIGFGHHDRMKAFRDTCAAKKHDLFDGPYFCRHVFLKILLCHPAYQRRGAGSALTSWGIEEARRLGLNTTVFASPMGFELYRKLGFREIGRFRVQLEGEDAFLEIPAMVLVPSLPGGPRVVSGGCREVDECEEEQEGEKWSYTRDSESGISSGLLAQLSERFNLRVRLWNCRTTKTKLGWGFMDRLPVFGSFFSHWAKIWVSGGNSV